MLAEPGTGEGTATAPAPALAPEQEAARLRNPAEIAQILTRVHDQHGLVTIHVAGTAGNYSSILLGLDLTGGNLLFDELHPRNGDRHVVAGAKLLVSARLDGSRIEFACKVQSSVSYKGAPAWRTTLPHSVDYFERRGSYRLSVPAALQLHPVVFDSPDGPLSARLVDISRRGLAALLDPEVEAGIGAQVPCTLRLLENTVSLDAEIRSSVRHQNRLRLGVLFPSMTPSQRYNLDASVARLERNLLRHYAAARPR